jgi:hypothetical protein
LPSPQTFEVTGISQLSPGDIQYYYHDDKAAIPLIGNLFEAIEKTNSVEEAQLIMSIDETMELKSQGYQLIISNNTIQITGKDKVGLMYGTASLHQIIEDALDQKVNLPLCEIIDYPLLSYRAIHLDVKHHLEKKEYYYDLMDRLFAMKINGIILEIEDKLKYERQPLVGSADAWSIEEWKELSNYAMERNIEISPLVQGLGHASFILKHDQYKNLRDNPESDWAFNPLDPETYEVQFDLYLDAIEATPYGRYLHVGGDEVRVTGKGSGRSSLDLQLKWLNEVCEFAAREGRIPIFWDDMPLKHANVYRPMFRPEMSKTKVDSIWMENEPKLLEYLDKFPKNCIYMRWNYHSPETVGNKKAMDWFTEHGFDVMGATAGQTRWVLMPQRESNIENIKSFALASIESGLEGLLLTLWDDDSPHFELYLRGIHAFAEYTWSGEKRTKEEVKSTFRHRSFGHFAGDEKLAFIDQLEVPVGLWKNIFIEKGTQRNNLTKMENPINNPIISLPDRDNKGQWSKTYEEKLNNARRYLKTCDSISFKIKEMKRHDLRNRYTLEVYEQVNNLVQFSFNSLLILENYDLSTSQEQEKTLIEEIKTLPEKFESLRSQFEEVYGKTRILNKDQDYLLDQDHHNHSANQSISFDWQFVAELLFMEKITGIKG